MVFTDHDTIYGAMEFYFTAEKLGIKPIIGCEVCTAKDFRLDKYSTRRDNGHLTMLARNHAGYQNLMKLVSKGFLEGFHHVPRIDMEVLEQYREGLVVISGCIHSNLSQVYVYGKIKEAVKIATRYSDILGKGNFFWS